MDLSRIEHDMEALVAEHPADETLASGGYFVPFTFSVDSAALEKAFKQMAEAFSSGMSQHAAAAAQLAKEMEALVDGINDPDPGVKLNRARRRRKPTPAVRSGASWLDDDRPGVRDFRRRQRRDMRRGSRH